MLFRSWNPMVMELNLDLNQSPAQLVADTDKLDQVRDFLQFNRRVQIVVDLENKFLRPVESVKVLVKNKLKRNIPTSAMPKTIVNFSFNFIVNILLFFNFICQPTSISK